MTTVLLGSTKWGFSLRDVGPFLRLCYLLFAVPNRHWIMLGCVDNSSHVNLGVFIVLMVWQTFVSLQTWGWQSLSRFAVTRRPRMTCFSKGFCQPMKPMQFRCIRRWYFAIAFLSFLHSGEATNPGPHTSDSHWYLGTFNPSGLNGKQQIIAEYLDFGDIWAVSETHLSSKAMFAFRKGLRTSENPFSTS